MKYFVYIAIAVIVFLLVKEYLPGLIEMILSRLSDWLFGEINREIDKIMNGF